jgi:hypothetical protein
MRTLAMVQALILAIEENAVWLKLDKEYRSTAGHPYSTWPGKEGID